mmetsp:Transcript_61920/g.189078  ORF Transcript_61920/g.189078 Transcript_61920/m.189078 type:complete len:285 (-) Transcript_61920:1644-2498(-)
MRESDPFGEQRLLQVHVQRRRGLRWLIKTVVLGRPLRVRLGGRLRLALGLRGRGRLRGRELLGDGGRGVLLQAPHGALGLGDEVLQEWELPASGGRLARLLVRARRDVLALPGVRVQLFLGLVCRRLALGLRLALYLNKPAADVVIALVLPLIGLLNNTLLVGFIWVPRGCLDLSPLVRREHHFHGVAAAVELTRHGRLDLRIHHLEEILLAQVLPQLGEVLDQVLLPEAVGVQQADRLLDGIRRARSEGPEQAVVQDIRIPRGEQAAPVNRGGQPQMRLELPG